MKDALPALGEKARGFKEIPFGKVLQAGDYRVVCSCVRCETPIVAEVLPFAKGENEYSLQQLQALYKVLTEEELAALGFRQDWDAMAQQTAFRLGSCPVIVKLLSCSFCAAPYVMFFSAGEQQPARDSVFVAGVWELVQVCVLPH